MHLWLAPQLPLLILLISGEVDVNQTSLITGNGYQPFSATTLTMAPGGVEMSVFQKLIFPGERIYIFSFVFSFATNGMRIFKLKP